MSERYLDSNISYKERAKDLLAKMSLEEKMAQTVGVFLTEELEEKTREACKHGMGAVSTLQVRMMTSLEQIAAAQKELQKYIIESSEHHIPAIFHMEGLCGAFIQDSTSFPSGIGRGSSFDTELEKQIGGVVARQERALGFTHTFAPVMDISRDSRLGRQGETYGEDPTLIAAMGTAYTRGVQEGETKGVRSEAVAKHFLGFHNSEAGIHGSASNTPTRLMTEIYGKPFQAAIAEANLRGVMPCYCSFDGEAASTSKKLLTDLLHDEMGFDGLTVADYGGIAGVHIAQKMFESLTEAGSRAMEAGMDLELPNKVCYNDELAEWLREGKIPMEILDRAVLRVLEAKFRMGLFEQPYALAGEELQREFYQEEDKKISLRSAEESVILMKNDGTLPMKKGLKKIAVIGPHAQNARSFFGGYTHLSMAEAVRAVANSLAGIGDKANNEKKEVPYVPGTQIQSDETEEFDALLRQIKPECKSLYAELKERLTETEVVYAYGYPVAGNDISHFKEALEALKNADLCILTLGGKHGSCSVASMGEGVDGANINLPECQDAFILKAAEIGVPLVGVHFNGRPISSDVADKYLNAIFEAWNPSEMGAEALVNILTGKVNPSGKLPVSVAYHAGQIPVYYNHPNGSSWHQGESIGFANYVDLPHTPRYFFGHGLSYTTFAYSNMKLSTKEMAPEGEVEISITLKNVGSCGGTEVVQLYVKDCYASMVRPCMELAGFRRVTLDAGQEKEVSFCLKASQLAFLDIDYRWKIEAGEVEVMIGASSADIRLKDAMQITESRFIKGRTRTFWA